MKRIAALLLAFGCASAPPPAPEPATSPPPPVEASPAPADACAQGDGAACKTACDGDHKPSCVVVGSILLRDGKADEAKSAFEKACAGGEQTACDLAQTIEALAPPTEACDPEDVEGCALACHRGNAESCAILGRRFLSGTDAARPEQKKAQKWFEIGCALGSADSCKNASALRRTLESR